MGQTALASTGSLLQTRTLGGHSALPKSERIVSQDPLASCMNIKVWELLPHLFAVFIPKLSGELSLPERLEDMVGKTHTGKQTRSLHRWWKNQFYSRLSSFSSPGSSLHSKLICRNKIEALQYPQRNERINPELPRKTIFSELCWTRAKWGWGFNLPCSQNSLLDFWLPQNITTDRLPLTRSLTNNISSPLLHILYILCIIYCILTIR